MFRSGGMALVLCAACTPVSNEAAPDPASMLSETVFHCNVEPVLAKSCSYTACHGVAGDGGIGAPLRIYTPGKLRATPPQSLQDLAAALTDAEHHANFESASGFNWNLASVDDNFLLRKPLPSALGGYEHKGGAIYKDKSDPSYVAIRDWLTGQGACK